jgi:hypothetical protein
MDKTNKYILLLVLALAAIFFMDKFGCLHIGPKTPLPPAPIPVPPEPPRPPEPGPEPEPDVVFTDEPQLRQVSEQLGKVLGDIESHMPAGHIYRDNDKITWGHETTHGIHSRLRQKYQQGGDNWQTIRPIFYTKNLSTEEMTEIFDMKPVGRFKTVTGKRINVMYPTGGKSVILTEPNSSVSAAARQVPSTLRGSVFNLYMVEQARSWDDISTYIFDEWVAYTNGSAVRLDLGIKERGETVTFMTEFSVYSICLAAACKSDDTQFKGFLKWHLSRAMDIYNKSNVGGAQAYWTKFKENADSENLRGFCKSYFGESWTHKVLGI